MPNLIKINCFYNINNFVGSITSRCSGNKPALLPRRHVQVGASNLRSGVPIIFFAGTPDRRLGGI